MAQVYYGLTDELAGNFTGGSGYTTELPRENVSQDSPAIQAKALEGLAVNGTFELDKDNIWLDIDEGSGEVAVTGTAARYTSGPALATHLTTQLNASALTHTYTVVWNGSGLFSIGATGSFTWLLKTGTHGSDNADNHAGRVLGFDDSADTASATSHLADEKRFSTATSFICSLPAVKTLIQFLWYAESDDGAAASYDDVIVFVDTNYRGDYRQAWDTAASESITLSARPTAQGTNQIQIGFRDPSTATGVGHVFVHWRHFDESKDHRVGLCKAFLATRDTANSRTLAALRGHRIIDGAQARNVGNYYAPPGIDRWVCEQRFEDWEVASWRLVFRAIQEHGRRKGVLFALDGSTLATGTKSDWLTAVNAAEVLWGTVQEFSGGDAPGQQNAYRTSSLSFEQLPP